MKFSKIDSLVYNLLVRRCGSNAAKAQASWWKRLHDRFAARANTVRTIIHQRPVFLNFGYTYPFIVRNYPNFNAPLLSATKAAMIAKGRKIRFVDIGAAIGDTILLIDSNLGENVSEYVCVDGNPDFFAYLKENTQHLSNIRIFSQLLASSRSLSPSLVRTNLGTASAIGDKLIQSITLDELFSKNNVAGIDVLKIDVDGFDGEVLGGATQILKIDNPIIIFEWHPVIWADTKTNTEVPFQTLTDCGYSLLLWFTNEGYFCGFSRANDNSTIALLKKLCLSRRTNAHLHFDVVALHPSAEHLWLDIAELCGWHSRRSRY